MVAATAQVSAASQLLRQSRIPALRRLDVQETTGEIVLTGSVASYYLKQLAQECVMPVLGVRQLRNHVVVAS
jgi:osmotically-inducible protein OsmY